MDLGLADDRAVVFGGASGIGKAIAEAFAREHAHVSLVDLSPETPRIAAEMGRTSGADVSGKVADVTNFAAIRQIATSLEQEGRFETHVVYAAGMGSGKFGYPFWNLHPDDWRRVWEVNLLGAAHVAHAFAPTFVAQRGGTLLFVSSIAGQIGSQTDPPYSAAKAALINFGQCAAKDFAPFGARVNILSPGMVKTNLNRSVWQAWHDSRPEAERQSYEAWTDEKLRRTVPLGRWQEPEDMAAMAVFLASDRAKNITGQTLNVDGGQVMHS